MFIVLYSDVVWLVCMYDQVRQSASLTLVEVAQLIRIDDIGQYVLTIILVSIILDSSYCYVYSR